MSWGSWGKGLSTQEMCALILHYLDCGITTFDHADIYGGYTTEAAFGKAFTQSGVSRESVQFITKCGILYPSEKRAYSIKHYNYSASYIIQCVETSLQQLQTDYIDTLLLHRPSPLLNPEEVMRAVDSLQQQGKIKAFGVSNFSPSQVDVLTKEVPVLVNQVACSVTDYGVLFDGTLDQCMVRRITPMAWSPLGSLFKDPSAQTSRLHEAMTPLESRYAATKDQLALAWLLKHPSGIHPVIGTTNRKRIHLASLAPEIDLALADWFSLLVASQGHKVP